MNPHKGPSSCLSSPQRLAVHGFASALIRFRQRQLVAAFEALRWNRIASASTVRAANPPASSKAIPSVLRCKKTASELRRQLSVCKEALRSSDEVAERLLLGKRLLPRAQRQSPEPVVCENGELTFGGSSGSRVSPSGVGTRLANDEHMELATVWHPPGNEDDANWKELSLLVEGLREENPKWAACLARVVRRLEANRITSRRQCGSPVEEAELKSYSLATEFKSDEVIFPGYGRLTSTEANSASELVGNVTLTAEREGNSIDSCSSVAHDHAYPTSENDLATVLHAQRDPVDQASSPLSPPQRPLSGSLSSDLASTDAGMTVGPPQRAPPRVPQPPLVPSVQISLLADRGPLLEVDESFRREAAADNPSSSTDTSSEDSRNLSGHDRSTHAFVEPLGALVADPSCPLAPEPHERPLSSTDRMAPPPDRLPAQGRPPMSPRFNSSSMTLTENIKLSSKVQEILGASMPRVASQNGVEAVGTSASSGSAPAASGHGSSGSLSVGLGTNSGVVWPPTMLYTPRATVGSLHAMPRNAAADEGDRQDGPVDNLSRSATSLVSNPYTPRHKTATRIGVAPLRNQASRTGSLRYPPSNLSRPFAVQRMSSGTLGQPPTPQPSAVPPSPRQMSGGVLGGTATAAAPKRGVNARSPSVSASPARIAGRGYQGPNPQQNQWPTRVPRPASLVAPTVVNPSANSTRNANGVSRQSSVERAPSAFRNPPAPSQGPFASSPSTSWMSPDTYAPLGGTASGIVSEPIRRTSFSSSSSGGANLQGSSTGPIGTGSSVPVAARNPLVVPKLPANGLSPCFNAKGAPPPQMSMPASAKGYSSIQLWTPRSQPQTGTDLKQAGVSREARELSIEPPQVGRSPSASLAMSPRAYQGISIPNTGGQSALLSKLSAWRA